MYNSQIKQYQTTLRTRLERLQKLKKLALQNDFTDTPNLDGRINAIKDEIFRLHKIRQELNETKFSEFLQSQSVT